MATDHPTGRVTPGERVAYPSRRTPWMIGLALAGIAIAALGYAAGQSSGKATPAAVADAGTAASGGALAPDISQMTPKEQFDRLIDRVTAAAESADTATVARFWPMASGAYQNLPPGDRDNDARFHMGWLHLFGAQYPAASALADTILASSPNHLFGYYLRANIAKATGDSAATRAATKAFLTHYDIEMAKQDHPEYVQHRAMLEKFRDATKAP